MTFSDEEASVVGYEEEGRDYGTGAAGPSAGTSDNMVTAGDNDQVKLEDDNVSYSNVNIEKAEVRYIIQIEIF